MYTKCIFFYFVWSFSFKCVNIINRIGGVMTEEEKNKIIEKENLYLEEGIPKKKQKNKTAKFFQT